MSEERFDRIEALLKDELTRIRSEMAIVQRLDNTMARQFSDLLTEVRAEHSRMDHLLSRVRQLEAAAPDQP